MPSLSAVARHEYYTELGNALPPPITDTPEYRQRRLTTAVEAFEALHPSDAYEALAVRIVLAGAHAVETLREAGVYREDFAKRKSCRAQAASMMREERAAKRMLAQEQKLRPATEAVAGPASAQPALASGPPPRAEPQAAPPPVQAAAPLPPHVLAPPPVAAPTHAPPHLPVQAGSAPPPSPEAIARAEAFVDEDVVAAAQIRHDRGVTPQLKARFRHLTLPSDPAVIDALVRGTSDVLTVLDEVAGETLNVAA
jgi:hypothetical protein